jgi:hypothetical protein
MPMPHPKCRRVNKQCEVNVKVISIGRLEAGCDAFSLDLYTKAFLPFQSIFSRFVYTAP